MSISSVRFIIAAILIMTGILIMVIQTFGVFRLKYALNRCMLRQWETLSEL